MSTVIGSLLVGSVPLPDTSAVLKCLGPLRQHLKRYPDGETGDRIQFVCFQKDLFPELIQTELDIFVPRPPKPKRITEDVIEEGMRLLDLKAKEGIHTGYDEAAIKSYQVFKIWKDNGDIPRGAKFQVSMPTLGNVVGSFIARPFQEKAERHYEEALLRSLHKIQQTIPNSELAIQLDMGVDMLYWVDGWEKPWWADYGKGYLADYISRMANEVKPGVELGFHFCFGDIAHKHTIEPDTLVGVVQLAGEIFKRLKRPATYMHCPVPLSAQGKLERYFKPIKSLLPILRENRTELFFGLVHAGKIDVTRDMIQVACEILEGFQFGVSTECGWGRTPNCELESIINISRSVSKPYEQSALQGIMN